MRATMKTSRAVMISFLVAAAYLSACGEATEVQDQQLREIEADPGMGRVILELSLQAWEGAGSPEVERLRFLVSSSSGGDPFESSASWQMPTDRLVWEAALDLESGDYSVLFSLVDRLGDILCWADAEFTVVEGRESRVLGIPLVCTLEDDWS